MTALEPRWGHPGEPCASDHHAPLHRCPLERTRAQARAVIASGHHRVWACSSIARAHRSALAMNT